MCRYHCQHGIKSNGKINTHACRCSYPASPLYEQWGLSNAGQTTAFNISVTSVFSVLVSQGNSRNSPAVVGVDKNDITSSGFFAYAVNQTTPYQDIIP